MKIVETTKEQCPACGLPTRPNAQLAGPSGAVYQGQSPSISSSYLTSSGNHAVFIFKCVRCGCGWAEPQEME